MDQKRQKLLFYSAISDKSWPAVLQEAFPQAEVVTGVTESDFEEVTLAVVWSPPRGLLARLPNLKFIQVIGAGVDHLISDPTMPSDVPMARLLDSSLTDRMREYVLMQCLNLHRRTFVSARNQRARKWVYLHPQPPERTCIGVMGVGNLGTACAQALVDVGFRVIGWNRSARPDLGFPVFTGDPAREFGPQADIVVVLLPLTASTRGMIDGAFLKSLPVGSALINVGRGGLIQESDLLQTLDSGHIAQAVLDVFSVEPLPEEHPFWEHPNVTVTPHNSSATNPTTAIAQVVDNIRRVLAGKDPANLINRSKGY